MTDFFTIQVQFGGTPQYYTYLCAHEYIHQLVQGDYVVVPTTTGWKIAQVMIINPDIQFPQVRRYVQWKQILGILHDLPDIATLNVNLEELGYEFDHDLRNDVVIARRA